MVGLEQFFSTIVVLHRNFIAWAVQPLHFDYLMPILQTELLHTTNTCGLMAVLTFATYVNMVSYPVTCVTCVIGCMTSINC